MLLKNPEGKYLLLRRNVEKYPDVSDMWDIVGGRIDPGKPLLENLKREVKEETQLELIKEPKLIYAQDILRTKGHHVVRLTYIGEIAGEPVLDEEHDEYKWLTLSEIENMPKGKVDRYFMEVFKAGLIKEGLS